MGRRNRFDGLTLVGLILLGFLMMNVVKDRGWLSYDDNPERASAAAAENLTLLGEPTVSAGAHPVTNEIPHQDIQSQDAIVPPYEHYFLTQGPHGFDYGHMAIDISNGKGAMILSPINGRVADLYIDEWSNTTLVLENERYIIELLHGIYQVSIGDEVFIGQVVGAESNQGNTVDAAGYSCMGRDCGYHSHLNIYDRSIGSNLNPLDLLPAQQ